MGGEIKKFKMTVRNRRSKVGIDVGSDASAKEASFKGTLWKVKGGGDRMSTHDWLERTMWISKNGCLAYWSKKEEKELVYFTAEDVKHATIVALSNDLSFKPWTFQVYLPP